MWLKGWMPTATSYSATISACEKIKQLGEPLELLQGTRQRGLEPVVLTCSAIVTHVITYSAALNAYDKA